MYQVVVSKTLAPKQLVKVFESGARVVLPPWDPMVSRRAYLLHRLSLIVRRVLWPEMGSCFAMDRGGALPWRSVSFECKGDLDFDQYGSLGGACSGTIDTVDRYRFP